MQAVPEVLRFASSASFTIVLVTAQSCGGESSTDIGRAAPVGDMSKESIGADATGAGSETLGIVRAP